MENILFRNVSSDELGRAVEIECECFPPDEAASLDSFRYRQAQAPDLFLGAYLANASENHELIGYVCSTLSPSQSLSHDSMSNHVSGSSSVCLHSVTTTIAHRRKGIASALLREYISRLSTAGAYERILLITHEELQPLYKGVGFELVGLSSVKHGSRPWYEMRMILPRSEVALSAPPEQPQSLPPGVLEALTRPFGEGRTARNLQDFPGGILDVSTLYSGEGVSRNKYDLICPRVGCGSIILKSGVGNLDERASVKIDPPSKPIHSDLTPLPAPPAMTHWWLITPSPMAFENIGFTRPIPPGDPSSAKKLKLLICAECDLGPLGWTEEGGKEFWLACSRMKYSA
ncbi:acyl-CoA N-acyltransferase [Scleroderma citrinum]